MGGDEPTRGAEVEVEGRAAELRDEEPVRPGRWLAGRELRSEVEPKTAFCRIPDACGASEKLSQLCREVLLLEHGLAVDAAPSTGAVASEPIAVPDLRAFGRLLDEEHRVPDAVDLVA